MSFVNKDKKKNKSKRLRVEDEEYRKATKKKKPSKQNLSPLHPLKYVKIIF
jgi:hypothetical protein